MKAAEVRGHLLVAAELEETVEVLLDYLILQQYLNKQQLQ
jgi:hypothetical protein